MRISDWSADLFSADLNLPILGSGIAMPEAPGESHPLFRPHPMQGWTPDFIPRLTGDAIASRYVDRIVPVSGGESLRLSRELALKEGILTGITGGATPAGALEGEREAPAGGNTLLMLPNTEIGRAHV